MFLQPLRLAMRSLIRRPGFSLLAIVTIALGAGANAAVFAVSPCPSRMRRDTSGIVNVMTVVPISRSAPTISPTTPATRRKRSCAHKRSSSS